MRTDLQTLPSGWTWTTLGEITDPYIVQSPPLETSFTYIEISSIDNGSKTISAPSRLAAAEAPTRARQHLRAGDVVISMTRPNLNAVARISEQFDGAIGSTGFCVLRPTLVDSNWLLYIAQSPQFIRAMTTRVQGVVYPAVRPIDIRSFVVPLPPLEEQRRLVAELDRQLTRISSASGSLRRTQANMKRYRAAVLKAACEGRLVPLGQVVPVGEVQLDGILRDGLTNGRSVPSRPGGFPVLRLTALLRGGLDLSQRKGGSWERENALAFLVEKGDFFVARGNGSLSLVGRGALLETEPDEVAFPDTMIRIRVDPEKYDPGFLRLVWDSAFVRRQIEAVARTTAGIYKINQGDLRKICLPAPRLDAQKTMVELAERLLSQAQQLETIAQYNQQRAQSLRNSILAIAFEGRLTTQDPNDEPASILLEKIRQEREAAAENKPRRRGRRPVTKIEKPRSRRAAR